MFEQKLRAAADRVTGLGYFPVYVSLHGSQNYGLDVYSNAYQSDYDFKCVVLPSLWDLIEGKKPASLTIETAEGQIDIKDIRIFCDALERMNPAYLESLATAHDLILPEGAGMERIRALLPQLMHERAARFAQACAGLFEEKAKRMCHDCPAAHDRIVKYGYDGKQPHHMYRLLLLLQGFESNGVMQLETPMHARALLMQLKFNEIPLAEVQKLIAEWRRLLGTARVSIEEKYGEPKTEAFDQIVRYSREMMYSHCLKNGM
ncbi:MAG: nucleotidyltransferase domain-containing protein [Clostridia bacterium]|nr:nucleotidyltransferase domain-containing protein [Clostridia bacterium]